MKTCPACGGADVRRSFVRPSEAKLHRLFSPYRCRGCGHRFWVVSQRMRTVAAVACSACVMGAASIAIIMSLPKHDPGWASEAALSSRGVDVDAGTAARAKEAAAAPQSRDLP